MAKVTILLAPVDMMVKTIFIKESESVPVIRENLPRYLDAGSFDYPASGETAAEEAFDLTNNPGRQEEREEKYGRGRSVSSGDVIDVDGEKWACLSFGWAKL